MNVKINNNNSFFCIIYIVNHVKNVRTFSKGDLNDREFIIIILWRRVQDVLIYHNINKYNRLDCNFIYYLSCFDV